MTIIMSNRHLHHATGPDMLRLRIDRLAVLASDQIEAGLTWLAGQCPDIFDAVVSRPAPGTTVRAGRQWPRP